ncbi:MAG: hypothetical protein P1P74_03115 [Desulfuromonadales bacterium]|nr:hypothetical protein [Desulfuromonadales bacterium]MDT8424069.1 hypothetical protein [Desulfuromonadales bacterium]
MKTFTKIFIALIVLCVPTLVMANAPDRPPAFLNGSHYRYDISFLWFDRLASGELSLAATAIPGQYQATLEARTLGVAAWLTGNRVHRYVALMEATPDDGRLRTLRFESHVIKGQGKKLKDRAKEYVFNYEKKRVDFRRASNGQFGPIEVLPMGDTPLNDFLTVFTNFRMGFFGSPAPGETLELDTFERGHPAKIIVTATPLSPAEHQTFFPSEGKLFQISMGEDILDTGGGKVFLWFDSLERPARAVVENVIGTGDVKGTLREEQVAGEGGQIKK